MAQPFPVLPSVNPPMTGGGGAPRNGVPYYRIPRMQVETTRLLEMPIRTSALRGLGATLNVLSIESGMAEAAAWAGVDPLDEKLDGEDKDALVGIMYSERTWVVSPWMKVGQRSFGRSGE